MHSVHYMIYDVFTDAPFAGNPLGVVLNATGLSGQQMQAIAREFNLSETIFFDGQDAPSGGATVRIFMPNGELPFAGHPTIGGAIALAGASGPVNNATVVLEEGVGSVVCTVTADKNGGLASFIAPKIAQPWTSEITVNEVADAIGIDVSSIGFDGHELSQWSAGVPYVMVPLRDRAVLAKLEMNPQRWLMLDVEREGKIAAGYFYTRIDEQNYQARMFAPWDGIAEDPATGSAAAAFAGQVWQAEGFANGVSKITIQQGVEMGRPSTIKLTAAGNGGLLTKATIAGNAVKVAEGTLFLPD